MMKIFGMVEMAWMLLLTLVYLLLVAILGLFVFIFGLNDNNT